VKQNKWQLALVLAIVSACGRDGAHPQWVLGRWKSADYAGASLTLGSGGSGDYAARNADERVDSSALMWRVDYPAPDSAVLCIEGEREIRAVCTPVLVFGDTLFMVEESSWTTLIRDGASIQPSHDSRRHGCGRCTTQPRLAEKLVAQAYMASMKSDLRNLIVFEEVYFADNVRYTASTSGFFSTAGVSRPDIRLTKDGYSAAVTHEKLPGVVCVIFLGSRPRAPATVEGLPTCSSPR
jgi:hypothetical protein